MAAPRLLMPLAGALGLLAGAAQADPGLALFDKHCAICHQPGGVGAPGYAPPLADAVGQRLAVEEGRDYVPRILRAGISGPIDTPLGRFNGAMPGFAQLPDAEAAQIINYVLGELNARVVPAGFVPYTAEEVAALKAKPASAPENRKLRERLDAALKAR
jgi:mono/diheme cytochrome c family protein